MPKYKPETAALKAKNLIKPYLKAGLNQHRLAAMEGVSQSAINQRLKHPAVQKELQKVIDRNLRKAGITYSKVYKRLDEQLDATRTISAVVSPDGKDMDANGQTCDFVEVPDWTARDKAIDKSLTLMGHIKHVNGKNENNGNDKAGETKIYIIHPAEAKKEEPIRTDGHIVHINA